MNDFLRPSLYGATHEIRTVEKRGRNDRPRRGRNDLIDVVGPVCESGDFLGLDRDLPDVGPGTLLAILTAGAYGFSMSSTNNSRPRPAEAMVDRGRWAVIRARETVDDLMRGETVNPDWQGAEAQ
jgi:diaminopimelate decarboxylase